MVGSAAPYKYRLRCVTTTIGYGALRTHPTQKLPKDIELESTISNLLFQKQLWWAVPRPTTIGYGALLQL